MENKVDETKSLNGSDLNKADETKGLSGSALNKGEKTKGLSGSALKIIAIISMFIDHIACVFIENNLGNQKFLNATPITVQQWTIIDGILREIGRLAFPLFCFTIVQGAIFTSNKKKYVLRLFLFSILSEIPFDLAFFNTPFYLNYQNVFFTMALGLCAIYGIQYWKDNKWMRWLAVIAAAVVAELLHTDYGAGGVIIITLFYAFRFEEKAKVLLGSFFEIFVMGIWEAGAVFAFIPMHFYNGKRGFGMKYFFYIFYPAHLVLLWMINRFMFG